MSACRYLVERWMELRMEIIRLKPGEIAPPDTDCIRIEAGEDGKFLLKASALDGVESMAIVGGGPYDSFDAAEAAGLAWSSEHHVQRVYVETMHS